jgi:hypothetical protein
MEERALNGNFRRGTAAHTMRPSGARWPFPAVRHTAALACSADDETFGAFVYELLELYSNLSNSLIIDGD